MLSKPTPGQVPDARDIDRHVGRRIRERRTVLGLTQQDLADSLGVTYQQAHKYERGLNRISAGRLYILAAVLGVEVGYFYHGLDEQPKPVPERQRLCLEMVRNFTKIADERHQQALASLCRVLTNPEVEKPDQ